MPVRLLAYNIRNGRFAAELRAAEADLERKLDPLVAEDAAILRELLLGQDRHATALLKADLKMNDQAEPGIITHDGFVINGNRRMAVLSLLHEEQPTGKWEYLDVLRLPPDVNERDLWKIEAGLQLSRDPRLVYGPINNMLKIRDGLEAGLSPEEIASALFGGKDAGEIRKDAEVLDLIDRYLEHIGDDQAYTKVNRLVQHFINLWELLQWMDKKQGVQAAERMRWMEIAFEMIRTGKFFHRHIRELAKIYTSESGREHLTRLVRPHEGPIPPAEAPQFKNHMESAFHTASDYAKLEEEARTPDRLVSRARRAVETLANHASELLEHPELFEEITAMRAELENLEGRLATSRGAV